MYTLQFGFRRGWPDRTTRTIVTHAVFRIVAIHNVPHNGSPQGYTGGLRGGMTVFDVDSLIVRQRDQTVSQDLSNIAYTWFPQTLDVSDAHYLIFYNAFENHAQTMLYTGVGCNCFTPMVRGLEALRASVQAGLRETEAPGLVNDIDQVLTDLLGQNYGMGTRITNDMIASGARLLFALALNVYLLRRFA